MPRPMVDANGSAYQELMKQRELYRIYGANYQEMKWATEALERLEQKTAYDYYTEQDHQELYKARKIIYTAHLNLKSNGDETADNHTTTHYIWHTQGDNKTRPSHAANNGKVFSWDNPPETGHPGEAYGCRCWAEPQAESDTSTEERISQIVTYAAPDVVPAWTREDFFYHYNHGKGKNVRLSEIGHLQSIIDHARTYDQGGGSIFKRVENEIFEKSRQSGEGTLPYHFINSYEFQPIIFEIGGATVAGSGFINVVDKGDFWLITADLSYTFLDIFIHPYDVYDAGIWPLTIDTGTPYPISGEWSTRIEAIIKK